MKKEIVVTVGLDGTVEVSAEGFKGKDCVAKSKFIEEALGISGKDRKFKPDYHQSETVAQQQKV